MKAFFEEAKSQLYTVSDRIAKKVRRVEKVDFFFLLNLLPVL